MSRTDSHPDTRPLRPADAAALHALIARHDSAQVGHADTTLDEVVADLADPDLDARSCVVDGGDGTLLAAVRVFHHGDSGLADLDVTVDPELARHLFRPLLAAAESIALAQAATHGLRNLQMDHATFLQDTVTNADLEAAGYAVGTTFHRMRRALDVPVDVPHIAGLRIRRAADAPGEDDLRLAHRLHDETFDGHFGVVARTWEDWSAARAARSDWAPMWFAELDGEPVGLLQETDQFVEDENAGYVLRLGVRTAVRGRGIARALLLTSFADMTARGRAAAILHVDAANATGALRLYESVGMSPVLQFIVWRKETPVR